MNDGRIYEHLLLAFFNLKPVASPFSSAAFSLSQRHRRTSSSDTIRETSSSFAARFAFTHSCSGQPTRRTSPSLIHRLQKSCKQERQNTCPHESNRHLAPFLLSRQTQHTYELIENWFDFAPCSNETSSDCSGSGVRCGILHRVQWKVEKREFERT
jgi:hypothetical protein